MGLAPLFWPGLGVADQRHTAAANNLAQARREAREFGHERRLEIRRRVQEFREVEKEEQEQRQNGTLVQGDDGSS